ncbi:DEAD/DEAH box helicase [Lichenicoccus sp.]|uniref:DEAD/DEAH box helicase n=1 Tax=Lichenicoccus sp. TaxID=2781899 RepID=UPI003D0DCFCB
MTNNFADFGLASPLLDAVRAAGYTTCTAIQSQAIPAILAGRDLQGIAQTGTGKTAAFALPILHRLLAPPQHPPMQGCRALVLSPTRELAAQIAERFRAYGRHTPLRTRLVHGGVPKHPQARGLAGGTDILVATPGRLLDLLADKAVRLEATTTLVLDEADHMLDLGFIAPIRRIARLLPDARQSLFFSATMPAEIAELAAHLLRNPVHVAVSPEALAAERIDQRVIFVDAARKRALLTDILRKIRGGRILVFARTKQGAERIVAFLDRAGLAAASLHGDKSQAQRDRALGDFRAGRVAVLVATDVAARGIDVDQVTHVINFDLPNVAESYVHRIGRTARAGAAGMAISFCDAAERPYLRDVEKLLGTRLTVSDPSQLRP